MKNPCLFFLYKIRTKYFTSEQIGIGMLLIIITYGHVKGTSIKVKCYIGIFKFVDFDFPSLEL